MIRQIRIALRENGVLRRLVRPLVVWLANDVLKWKCRRLRKYGYAAVSRVCKVARDTDVPCYADFGTLLGFVRDKAFIAHDQDIDFSFLPNCSLSKIVDFYRHLEEEGFIFERFILFDGFLKEFSVRYSEISIDFFIQRLSSDGSKISFVDEYHDGSWTKYDYAIPSRLINYQLGKCDVIIPENYDEVLRSEYGEWHVVIKKWNSVMGPEVMYVKEVHDQVECRNYQQWMGLLDQYSK